MAAKKKAEFKRILIHEDNGLFGSISKQMVQFKPHLERLKTQYELLGIGPFSNQVFKDLLNGGIEKYIKAYEKVELDKSNTSSQVLIDQIKVGVENKVKPLANSITLLKSFQPVFSRLGGVGLSLEHIVYNDKLMVFWIGSEQREIILDRHCRLYIENDQEKKAFDSLEKVRKAYLEFLKNSKPFRGVGSFDAGELRYLLWMGKDEEPEINTIQFKQFVNNGKIFAGFYMTMASTKAKQGIKSSSSTQSIIEESLL